MLETYIVPLINGLLPMSFWAYVAVALALTHVTIVAVTVYLHRHQAHRALDLHPAVSHFFRFWLWLTTGMVTAEWVAVHRKHHARCETEEDPHSPQILGIGTVVGRGAELYREAADDQALLDQYSHGTPDDWLERHLYRPRSVWGPSAMLIINVALFGAVGLTIWAVQMIWIPFWAAGVINGIGHYWGYRNFESADAARNVSPWGILIGGEELHNNHHAFPSSARLSSRSWEFDIGWMYIRLLEMGGLAKVKKVAMAPRIVEGMDAVSSETVSAVLKHRMHVAAQYAREVILPVVRDEWHCADASCRRALSQASRLLVRENSLLDESARGRLEKVLSISQRLNTVYEYRQRLQAIWARSSLTQDQLRQALHEWCVQAEKTGIQALEEFAGRLRGYRVQTI